MCIRDRPRKIKKILYKIKPPKIVLFFIMLILSIFNHNKYILYSQDNFSFSIKNISKDLFFGKGGKFTYKVSYNGIYVGNIECIYLGKQNIDNKLADTLELFSDVRILGFFSIQSRERLFIDSSNQLPLKVERKVKYLGKDEEILEEYSQQEGLIKITKKYAKGKTEKRLEVGAPIHNIIALLYFFPQNLKLNPGKQFVFNLPTQKINIRVKDLALFDTYEAYILEEESRRFKVWLERDKRIPLRIEFNFFLGRIVISKFE
ncbi:MAG: DUF3108 domain-containing protein, partial [Candidatus Omnitrophica bacterium]|nr:DUF3108 domain-containing protein [Candidatus Omnitrophota bacterium]